MSSSTDSPILRILTSWQTSLAIATAVAYFIGYMKSLAFLLGLGTIAIPTEIYSLGSLLILGLTSLLAGSVVPLLLVLACLLFVAALWLTEGRSWTYRAALIIASFLVLLIAWFLGFQAGRDGFSAFLTQILQLRVRPTLWHAFGLLVYIYIVGLLVLIIVAVHDFRRRIYNRPIYFCVGLIVIWAVIGSAAQEYYLGKQVLDGHSPIGQRSAMRGTLLTSRLIAEGGSPAPNFGTNAYLTRGVLLSRRDGAYYFYPTLFAAGARNNWPNVGLIIVPEGIVISFLQVPFG